MKPTPELLKRTISKIEIFLDVRQPTRQPCPNIDAAIRVLENLQIEMAEIDYTPVDVLGICSESIEALDNAGITKAEELELLTFEQLVAIPRIDGVRALEIVSCVEIWREWSFE